MSPHRGFSQALLHDALYRPGSSVSEGHAGAVRRVCSNCLRAARLARHLSPGTEHTYVAWGPPVRGFPRQSPSGADERRRGHGLPHCARGLGRLLALGRHQFRLSADLGYRERFGDTAEVKGDVAANNPMRRSAKSKTLPKVGGDVIAIAEVAAKDSK